MAIPGALHFTTQRQLFGRAHHAREHRSIGIFTFPRFLKVTYLRWFSDLFWGKKVTLNWWLKRSFWRTRPVQRSLPVLANTWWFIHVHPTNLKPKFFEWTLPPLTKWDEPPNMFTTSTSLQGLRLQASKKTRKNHTPRVQYTSTRTWHKFCQTGR